MEYFKSSIKYVVGTTPEPEVKPSGAEMIERLVNRLQSSSLLDDRRDACRALKALSRNHRVEVGALAMEPLLQVLHMDKTDSEIVALALDTLCNITSKEVFDDEDEAKHNIGEEFTEILVKNESSVSRILMFLEEFESKVRWPALKILSNLLTHKLKIVQEIILVSPMGISKLMDILADTREVIRNDALLVLIQLTKGNSNIQKIVAFENAFDRIFILIHHEGGVEGGIVVEDCLILMLNLLRSNYSNQNFFKEGSYIQKLTPMFELLTTCADEPNGWSPQKMSNVYCLTQIVRALVAPNGPAQSVAACQKIMKSCGLLETLCNILMMVGIPQDTLTELINTVAEIIRGDDINQEFLANVMAPSNPPRPVILVLLMSMINDKQTFSLRCAVLYCFQCFLYKNVTKQMELVQTLLPQGTDRPSLTSGQLLCGGICSSDSLSIWFSAVALSHALIEGTKQKEELVKVHLATNIGTPPVSLMSQCITLLQQNNNIQSKLGILILLCTWTAYSPAAVKAFVSIEFSVSYLIALLSSHEFTEDVQEILLKSMCAFLIGICVHFNDDSVPKYTKSKLRDIVENRIGLEKIQDTIGNITKHEVYSRTLKHPQLSVKTSEEILLDHEFCRLLKNLETVVLKTISSKGDANNHNEDSHNYNLPENPMIAQYKDLIREQDAKITMLIDTVNGLTKEKHDLVFQMDQLRSKVDSLVDENKVLRAAHASFSDKLNQAENNHTSHEKCLKQIQILQEQVKRCEDLENQISKYEDIIKEMKSDNLENAIIEKLDKEIAEKTQSLNKLTQDQNDLLALMMDQDKLIDKYQKKLHSLGICCDEDDSCVEHVENHNDSAVTNEKFN
ncbi:unnamed protein product [Trichogramma brassicae]|uniref:Vesicle tethering protein Uso1/P115-like head domain-containing protein n=1 Tax=Trichogramma brassicae TaxID=86971 RepID=A0A6H5J3G9_9HYME|nr:unnamed protein product [Trichogramma brassicae]